MRIRSIKPDFFKHDGLAALPPLTRLLFQGLWCMADSAGRLEDRPKRIKAEVVPYDDCSVEDMLTELAVNGFIVRYEVSGAHFIAIPNFRRHQRITGKEADAESRFPAPTEEKRASKGKRRGNTGETPEQHPESLEGKGDGRERKGDDGGAAAVCFPEALDTADFREAWQSYIDYRRTRKLSALTDASVRLRLKEMAEWGEADAIASIQHTIANGWQGIFRPKAQPPDGHKKPNAMPLPEISAERAAAIQAQEQAELEQIRRDLMSAP